MIMAMGVAMPVIVVMISVHPGTPWRFTRASSILAATAYFFDVS